MRYYSDNNSYWIPVEYIYNSNVFFLSGCCCKGRGAGCRVQGAGGKTGVRRAGAAQQDPPPVPQHHVQPAVRHHHRFHATSRQPPRLCGPAQTRLPRRRVPQTRAVPRATRRLRGAHGQHVLLHAHLQHARVPQRQQIHGTHAAARRALQQAQPHTHPRLHLSLPPAEQRPRPHDHGVRHARPGIITTPAPALIPRPPRR